MNLKTIHTTRNGNLLSGSKGTELYNTYKDSLTGDFEQRYMAKCMEAYRHDTLKEYWPNGNLKGISAFNWKYRQR